MAGGKNLLTSKSDVLVVLCAPWHTLVKEAGVEVSASCI